MTTCQRAELAVVEVEEHLSWLEKFAKSAIQVIGPCGHGKSTHLRAWQYAWAARKELDDRPAFVYFPEEGHQPALPRTRPLFIDEAQRMGWWRRRQMLAGPGPLVIGTHCDLSRELSAAGFQLLVIDLDQPMPPERLQELLNRRIVASRVSPQSIVKPNAMARAESKVEQEYHALFLTITQVVALQQRFGSNIRLIEDYLYQQFQNSALKGEPWLPVK